LRPTDQRAAKLLDKLSLLDTMGRKPTIHPELPEIKRKIEFKKPQKILK
jgi:hypothetical protein